MKTLGDVPDAPLIVGVSGGCDSMVLAHLLYEAHYDFIIAHVHHGLRTASDEEATFIENWARERNITFRMTRLEWRGQSVSQARCREERYLFFEQVMQETGRKHLLLAHHGDDQLETLLIQLLRGEATVDGIPMNRSFGTGKIHRPLMNWTKQELLDYAMRHQIEWREDATNAETKYLRNRIRHDILPRLAQIRPGFEEATIHAALLRQQVQAEHQTYVKGFIQRHMTDDGLPVEEINLLPTDLRRLVLPTLIPGLSLSKDGNDRFLAWLRVDMPSSEVYYGNWRIRRTYGYLTCVRQSEVDSVLEPFQVEASLGTYRYGEHQMTFSRGDRGIPLPEITFPLTVRSPLPGDRIQLAVGTKKVSRILIDAKVPAYLRAEVPVVVDATGQVLAVIGHRIAKFGSFELFAGSYLMIEW